MSDPTIDPSKFRQVLGHFPTGVTVVTAMAEGKPVGMAIGSFTSVSLDPPLVAFLPASTSSSWPRIRAAGFFCVNVLAEDQEDVCRIFASKSDDKFANIGWGETESGSPVIKGSLAWIDCRIEAVHAAGDHDIVVGRVLALDVSGEGGPLVFFRGGYGRFAL